MDFAWALVITSLSRLMRPVFRCSKISKSVMIFVILAGLLLSVAFSSQITFPVEASIRI